MARLKPWKKPTADRCESAKQQAVLTSALHSLTFTPSVLKRQCLLVTYGIPPACLIVYLALSTTGSAPVRCRLGVKPHTLTFLRYSSFSASQLSSLPPPPTHSPHRLELSEFVFVFLIASCFCFNCYACSCLRGFSVFNVCTDALGRPQALPHFLSCFFFTLKFLPEFREIKIFFFFLSRKIYTVIFNVSAMASSRFFAFRVLLHSPIDGIRI